MLRSGPPRVPLDSLTAQDGLDDPWDERQQRQLDAMSAAHSREPPRYEPVEADTGFGNPRDESDREQEDWGGRAVWRRCRQHEPDLKERYRFRASEPGVLAIAKATIWSSTGCSGDCRAGLRS